MKQIDEVKDIIEKEYDSNRMTDATYRYIMKKLNEAQEQVKLFAISDVSNMLNADNCITFDEWLNKYFQQPEQTITYKERYGKKRIPIDELKRKYMRAFNVSI